MSRHTENPFVLLIYNPMAGGRIFPSKLDFVLEMFQETKRELRIHRSVSPEDIEELFLKRSFDHCESILVAGGDGTVNMVINAMIHNEVNVPLGIIPAGTANDFATHLKMPVNISEAIENISNGVAEPIDVGIVNGRYFINVCSGGLLSNISQSIDIEVKNALGRMAYYLKGVQQLPNFRPIPFRITTEENIYEEELFLFLVLNGSKAGGFTNIGTTASVVDGLLDFVGIRACNISDMPILFAKILMGDHLNDRNILYFQAQKIYVECLKLEDSLNESDIDGESGPVFPLDIQIVPKAISIIRSEV